MPRLIGIIWTILGSIPSATTSWGTAIITLHPYYTIERAKCTDIKCSQELIMIVVSVAFMIIVKASFTYFLIFRRADEKKFPIESSQRFYISIPHFGRNLTNILGTLTFFRQFASRIKRWNLWILPGRSVKIFRRIEILRKIVPTPGSKREKSRFFSRIA